MPKLEKDRPMTATISRIKTDSDNLTQALEDMLKKSRKFDLDPNKDFEIIVREVEIEAGQEPVTREQQRLLDMVNSTLMTKTEQNSTGDLRKQRQSMDGYDSNGFKLDDEKK